MHQNHRATERVRVDLDAQPLQRENGRILVAVVARDQGQCRAGARAFDGRHGNLRAGVLCGGNLNYSRCHAISLTRLFSASGKLFAAPPAGITSVWGTTKNSSPIFNTR